MIPESVTKLVAIPIAVAVLFGIIMSLPTISNIMRDVRTDATSESLGCTTGAAVTACVITLTDPHAHGDETDLTVTETSPGSGTKTATVNRADRTQVTVSGLTAGTTFTFTVAYLILATNVNSDESDAMKWIPILIFVAAIALVLWLVFGALAGAAKLVLFIVGVVLALFAILLLPVVNDVTADAAADAASPGLTGLLNFSPIIWIAVTLGIVAVIFIRIFVTKKSAK